MRNLLLTIAYDGRRYHGWQVQQNAPSVQQCLQDALEQVLGERPPVKGCSRTDAGVHARMFCVGLTTDCRIPCDRLVLALGTCLPGDIAPLACREVGSGFHARSSVRGKQYSYELLNSDRRDPFLPGLITRLPRPALDAEQMEREGQPLLGRHDFAAFCASGSSVTDTVREVTQFGVQRQGDIVKITITADGFLYNMVRIIAGTLIGIEQGRLERGSMAGIIASRDRSRAGITMPPDGLYLQNVYYDD